RPAGPPPSPPLREGAEEPEAQDRDDDERDQHQHVGALGEEDVEGQEGDERPEQEREAQDDAPGDHRSAICRGCRAPAHSVTVSRRKAKPPTWAKYATPPPLPAGSVRSK